MKMSLQLFTSNNDGSHQFVLHKIEDSHIQFSCIISKKKHNLRRSEMKKRFNEKYWLICFIIFHKQNLATLLESPQIYLLFKKSSEIISEWKND